MACKAILQELGDLLQSDGRAGWCCELLVFVVVKPVQATAGVSHARGPCGRESSDANCRQALNCVIR